MREKEFGIWQTHSWSVAAATVRAIACGFAALGMQRGDKIAIIGDNRPQFYWSMLAAQCLGAVPVPVYQDAVAEEMQFVLDHAETRFAVAENQEQVDKLLGIKDRLPHLGCIIYKDPRGLRHYRHDHLLSLDSVQERGARLRCRASRLLPRRGCQGQWQRRIRHRLYVGNDGAAQGRDVVVRQSDFGCPARPSRFDRLGRGRPGAGLPADGLDRRPSVLLCAGHRGRLRRQLPGERRNGDDRPEGDRAELFLCPAAHLREHPDPGDDPHGGCGTAEAPACSVISCAWRDGAASGYSSGRRVSPRRPGAVCAGRSAGLWAVAQCAWAEPGPRRLYRR